MVALLTLMESLGAFGMVAADPPLAGRRDGRRDHAPPLGRSDCRAAIDGDQPASILGRSAPNPSPINALKNLDPNLSSAFTPPAY